MYKLSVSLGCLTPGINVKKLYFWFFIAFLGYFSSHFSGHPSHTVRALSSFFLRQMFISQSQQLQKERGEGEGEPLSLIFNKKSYNSLNIT